MSNLNHLIEHRFSIILEVVNIEGGMFPIVTRVVASDGITIPHEIHLTRDGRLMTNKPPVTTFPEAPQIPWSDCPWAQYAAMDEGGKWYFFSHKPDLKGNFWGRSNGRHSVYSPFEFQPVANWKQSLIKRP